MKTQIVTASLLLLGGLESIAFSAEFDITEAERKEKRICAIAFKVARSIDPSLPTHMNCGAEGPGLRVNDPYVPLYSVGFWTVGWTDKLYEKRQCSFSVQLDAETLGVVDSYYSDKRKVTLRTSKQPVCTTRELGPCEIHPDGPDCWSYGS